MTSSFDGVSQSPHILLRVLDYAIGNTDRAIEECNKCCCIEVLHVRQVIDCVLVELEMILLKITAVTTTISEVLVK
jgi:hypothetical protein